MEGIKRIVGPAPSELSYEDCLALVRKERQRTREAFARFRAAPPAGKKTRKPSKKKRHAELQSMLDEFDLTPEELSALIKEGKK